MAVTTSKDGMSLKERLSGAVLSPHVLLPSRLAALAAMLLFHGNEMPITAPRCPGTADDKQEVTPCHRHGNGIVLAVGVSLAASWWVKMVAIRGNHALSASAPSE